MENILPIELWYIIFNTLDINSQKKFRTVCKTISYLTIKEITCENILPVNIDNTAIQKISIILQSCIVLDL